LTPGALRLIATCVLFAGATLLTVGQTAEQDDSDNAVLFARARLQEVEQRYGPHSVEVVEELSTLGGLLMVHPLENLAEGTACARRALALAEAH